MTHYADITKQEDLSLVDCVECLEKMGMLLLGEGTLQCQRCGNLPTLDSHTCPYSEDVNNDYESKCNCCSDCQGECCMDI